MILKTSLEVLEKAMGMVSSIVNDKMLQEDLKNVIIWVKEGKIRFAGNNGNIISATDIEGKVDLEGVTDPEVFVQLKAKDINDVLATFRGLKRTKVERVEFHIKENEAVMHVIEVPLDDMMNCAEKYNQETKFRITKPRLKDAIKKQIQEINLDVEGIDVNSADLQVYINALLPTVAKETREGTSNVLFGEEHIYTVLATYAAIMPNKLPEEISDFRIPNTVVNFVKNFTNDVDAITFDKNVVGNGLVVVTIKKPGTIAVIKCADMSRAFNIENFIELPQNGVVVDKMYLIDVLKRMSLSSEAAFVKVNIENGGGTLKVVSKNMTQEIPVTRCKGEGEFSFSIRPDLLSSVVFSHTSVFDDDVFLYFDIGERGNIIMGCTDNSQLWHTKMMGLTSAKGDFAWN